MTALKPEQLAVRLRLSAERAAGSRVLVDKDDLLRILDIPQQQAVDLDELFGGELADHDMPPALPDGPLAPGQGVLDRAVQPPSGKGRRNIVLAATNVDAFRLAQAAWDSDEARVAIYGLFDRLEPGPQWEMVLAARRAIDLMAAG